MKKITFIFYHVSNLSFGRKEDGWARFPLFLVSVSCCIERLSILWEGGENDFLFFYTSLLFFITAGSGIMCVFSLFSFYSCDSSRHNAAACRSELTLLQSALLLAAALSVCSSRSRKYGARRTSQSCKVCYIPPAKNHFSPHVLQTRLSFSMIIEREKMAVWKAGRATWLRLCSAIFLLLSHFLCSLNVSYQRRATTC